MKNKEKAGLILIGFLILGNFFVWREISGFLDYNLKVIYFDVGQGDATFIETAQKHQIIIDGGPDSAILEKLSGNMPFWDRTIDLIILTHPHSDHLSGLINVLERYRVKNILWTGVFGDLEENDIFLRWLQAIEKEGARIYISRSGQNIVAGSSILEILHPFESFNQKQVPDINNTSIAARLVFGKTSFLFTGDAYKEVELTLVDKFGEKLRSNVLKAGHHGSRTSTARNFIETVLPEIAVISAGKNNRLNHPHLEVLETFDEYGVAVKRTDIQGDIKFISNGAELFAR